MATQTTDDLDGSKDATTRRFQVGSDRYEIDLTDANYRKLFEVLQPFTSKARHSIDRSQELKDRLERGMD